MQAEALWEKVSAEALQLAEDLAEQVRRREAAEAAAAALQTQLTEEQTRWQGAEAQAAEAEDGMQLLEMVKDQMSKNAAAAAAAATAVGPD